MAALLIAALCCPVSVSADAGTIDASGYQTQKERRLNIAGWTLVGAGIAFPVIATSISASKNLGEDCDIASCPDVSIWVTSMVLGPVMVVTGMGLLLKRRGLRRERENGASVTILPGLAGLSVSGRF